MRVHSFQDAITVDSVSKYHGTQKNIDAISFTVPKGSICGFVGPNGAGKSTTMRMLLALARPSQGSIKVLDNLLPSETHYLQRVGAMIEGPGFYPSLTGYENLRVLASAGGFRNVDFQLLLEQVGLGDRGHSKYKSYSLGMKQRLGIAAALIPDPDLLILDEPTNGLDPTGIAEIRALLLSKVEAGATVFISSHLLLELEAMCDYFIMLQKGRILFAGSAEELLDQSAGDLKITPENYEDLNYLHNLLHAKGFDAIEDREGLRVIGAASYAAEINRIAHEDRILLAELTPQFLSLEESFFALNPSD